MDDRPLADVGRRPVLAQVLFFVMRLLPIVRLRNAVARLLAALINASTRERPEIGTEAKRNVGMLRREGPIRVPPVLSDAQLQEILDFLRGEELVAKDGRRFRPEEAPWDIGSASYPLGVVLRCPHVLDLVNLPVLVELAALYLGCKPTVSGLRIDWSIPSGDQSYVQQFHRDFDDWRSLKAFVYLSDVDVTMGPHEFVRGSHLTSGRLQIKPYSNAGVERRFGREAVLQMMGKAGTSFLADPWGIHRGGIPLRGQRLLLQVQYSILPVYKSVYRPLKLAPRPSYDAYVNRLLMSSLE